MATVKQRFIHMAPRKLRLIADAVRGQSLDRANAFLTVTPRVAAHPISAAIKSAVAAEKQTNGDWSGDYIISTVFVDEGPALKRRILRGRGRSSKMEHRMSHLTLTIAPLPAPQPKKRAVKSNGEES